MNPILNLPTPDAFGDANGRSAPRADKICNRAARAHAGDYVSAADRLGAQSRARHTIFFAGRCAAGNLAAMASWGLAAALLLAGPAMASGPYAVDDAAITPAGAGQVEAWVNARADGYVLTVLPATTFRALPFVEWTLGFDAGRDPQGGRRSGGWFQAKARFADEPDQSGDVGFAAFSAVRFDFADGRATDLQLVGITTVMATDWLLVHGNLGVQHQPPIGVSELFWGGRAEASLARERLTFHAELFGTNRASAGFQIGVRRTIGQGDIDLEFAFSRNLADERASWATLGLAVRF